MPDDADEFASDLDDNSAIPQYTPAADVSPEINLEERVAKLESMLEEFQLKDSQKDMIINQLKLENEKLKEDLRIQMAIIQHSAVTVAKEVPLIEAVTPVRRSHRSRTETDFYSPTH